MKMKAVRTVETSGINNHVYQCDNADELNAAGNLPLAPSLLHIQKLFHFFATNVRLSA
jgi:hypothetical protein